MFIVYLGGIVTTCLVKSLVYLIVKSDVKFVGLVENTTPIEASVAVTTSAVVLFKLAVSTEPALNVILSPGSKTLFLL